MKFQFTYRHVDVSPTLTTYAQEQFERVGRHLLKDSRCHVFFSMGRYDYRVEVTVSGGWGHFKASSRAEDFYVAVDQAAEKLERQFMKVKDRHQDHHKPELSKEGQLQHVNEMLEFGVGKRTA